MATAQVTYTATGGESTYAFSFTYLNSDHVKLYLDGVEDTSATFPTASSITASAGNPAVNTVVLVIRETPRTALLTTISNSGSIRNTDLNNQSLQALYVAEEARDKLDGVMSLSADGTYWDAQVSAVNKLISNVLDPVSDQDASTKAYTDLIAATAVSDAQTAASTATTQVLTAADVVTTNADVVLTNADVVTAGNSASTATTQASNASTSASNASTSETNAAASESAAQAAQTAAETAADNFDDTYLGAKASAPTVDNDGDALSTGDLYFNTGTNDLWVYNGSVWQLAAVSTAGFPTLAGTNAWTGTNDFQGTLTIDGVQTTSDDDGTKTTGTYTPVVTDGNFKEIVNGGAFTLAPPAETCTMVIQVLNNASAGAITTSGFTIVDGDAQATTNTNKFMYFICRTADYSYLTIKALQ